MAITVSGTTITFNDASTQTSAVLTTIAGASAGAVGTYAFLKDISGGTTTAFGSTQAGSSLSPSGIYATIAGNNPKLINTGSVSGTWRCMGYSYTVYCCGQLVTTTLWVRIS
jgi:hypothetical protein